MGIAQKYICDKEISHHTVNTSKKNHKCRKSSKDELAKLIYQAKKEVQTSKFTHACPCGTERFQKNWKFINENKGSKRPLIYEEWLIEQGIHCNTKQSTLWGHTLTHMHEWQIVEKNIYCNLIWPEFRLARQLQLLIKNLWNGWICQNADLFWRQLIHL